MKASRSYRGRWALGGKLAVALAGLAIAGLAGCSTIRDSLGMNKTPPDEFTVMTQAPLVMPPDFTLRPPDNAAPPSRLTPPRQLAEQAVIGAPVGGTGGGADAGDPGETAFLREAGALNVNPNIREIVNSEFANLADRPKSFTDKLMFWHKEPPPGSVIDPTKEAARLRQNAATGQPVTAGDTPTIQHHSQGLLEGLF